jgi:hypothetical protein
VARPISRRIGSILDTFWYVGSAPETLMVLLALLAVTLGFAALFPQQPPWLQGAAAVRWVASAAGEYPGIGQFLSQIGMFTIDESAWLRALGAILAFNVALRLAIHAAALVQLARDRRKASTVVEFATLNGHDVNTLPDHADPLGHRGDGAQSTIPATAGALMAYAGALIILVGLFHNGIAGWRATEIALAPGGRLAPSQRDGACQGDRRPRTSRHDVGRVPAGVLHSGRPAGMGSDRLDPHGGGRALSPDLAVGRMA